MTPAHTHLLLNHFPVIGVLIALLLFVLGYLRKSREIEFAALVVLVVVAMAAVPTFLSGGAAEESVEDLPNIAGALIEPHEEAATIALAGAIVLGIVALLALVQLGRQSNATNKVVLAVVLLALVETGLLGWTGLLGGKIAHPEVRDGTPITVEQGESEDDD